MNRLTKYSNKARFYLNETPVTARYIAQILDMSINTLTKQAVNITNNSNLYKYAAKKGYQLTIEIDAENNNGTHITIFKYNLSK